MSLELVLVLLILLNIVVVVLNFMIVIFGSRIGRQLDLLHDAVEQQSRLLLFNQRRQTDQQ